MDVTTPHVRPDVAKTDRRPPFGLVNPMSPHVPPNHLDHPSRHRPSRRNPAQQDNLPPTAVVVSAGVRNADGQRAKPLVAATSPNLPPKL
jgi:hypothetical protein